MKTKKIILLPLILFISFHFCFAQEIPKAILIDEFGKECSESLMARYDVFFVQLNNEPTATGYIIFYGDEKVEGRNLSFISWMTLIYPKRRFDPSRIKLVRGENRAEMKLQFWLVPADATPPKPENDFVEQNFTSTMLFDKNWADFNRDSGALDIYSDGFFNLGCEFAPNVREFARKLLEDSTLTGYLVIYTKFGKGKKYGNRIASFAVVDLINNYKVPRNRLKTIYDGNREKPEIEFWFVPKDDKPPTPKPNSTS